MNFTEPQNECYCINLESTGHAPTAEVDKKYILGFTFCALKGMDNKWRMIYLQSVCLLRRASEMSMGLVIQKKIAKVGKLCVKTLMTMNMTAGVEVC